MPTPAERHLALAEQHIAEAEARITRQCHLVERLAANGLDTTQAETLLRTIRATLTGCAPIGVSSCSSSSRIGDADSQ